MDGLGDSTVCECECDCVLQPPSDLPCEHQRLRRVGDVCEVQERAAHDLQEHSTNEPTAETNLQHGGWFVCARPVGLNADSMHEFMLYADLAWCTAWSAYSMPLSSAIAYRFTEPNRTDLVCGRVVPLGHVRAAPHGTLAPSAAPSAHAVLTQCSRSAYGADPGTARLCVTSWIKV